VPKKQVRRTEKRILRRPRSAKPADIYELKITLRGSKPPIWRSVAVPSYIRLSDLHKVIQTGFGWDNYHLHQFIVPNVRTKPTREKLVSLEWRGRYERLAMHRDRCVSDPRFELEDIEDERKVRLCELAPAVTSKFIYEYDFGDGWEHEIKVVKIGLPVEGIKYPVCLSGELACPPEDCGGIWGYYEKLEILKNPKQRDYKDILEWMPRGFSPEYFDIGKVNAELAKIWSGKSRLGH